jgi:hypothetical protein
MSNSNERNATSTTDTNQSTVQDAAARKRTAQHARSARTRRMSISVGRKAKHIGRHMGGVDSHERPERGLRDELTEPRSGSG